MAYHGSDPSTGKLVRTFAELSDAQTEAALANGFRVGGSVLTADIARGKRVASRADAGMTFVNHPAWTALDLPGGIKVSGYGRMPSGMGIQEFVELVRVPALPARRSPMHLRDRGL